MNHERSTHHHHSRLLHQQTSGTRDTCKHKIKNIYKSRCHSTFVRVKKLKKRQKLEKNQTKIEKKTKAANELKTSRDKRQIEIKTKRKKGG